VETLGEIVEESFQVALLGDGLGDFKQGFDLAGRVVVGRSGGRGCDEARIVERWMLQISHKSEDSTRLAEVTTKRGACGCARDLRILGVLGDWGTKQKCEEFGSKLGGERACRAAELAGDRGERVRKCPDTD